MRTWTVIVTRKMKPMLFSKSLFNAPALDRKRGRIGAAGLASLLLACHARGGAFTNLASFSTAAGPYGGLVQAADGNLYGTTQHGGAHNFGTVFRVSTNGALTNLYSFTGGNDGAAPYAALVQGQDGDLYGTALYGGSSSYGTVFKITTNGALSALYSFTGGNDGGNPYGALVQRIGGVLFGTAATGGGYGFGAVFRLTTNGSFSTLYWFTGGIDGAYPYAGLVQGFDGNLYGAAAQGGPAPGSGLNYGTVFQITPGGTLTPLHSFSGSDGAYPYGALAQGSDGNLYGTTSGKAPNGGGVLNSGTAFRISYSGAFTPLYFFTGVGDGAAPYGALVQASDGNFYGTCTSGTNNFGTLFQLATNGALTTLETFNSGNGANPYSGLAQGIDGNLYGTTSSGGANDGGTVFQFTLTAPPFIIVAPASRTITTHTAATFQVLAGGTGPLSYRWLKQGTNLTDGGNVSGSATSTLTLSNISSADVGYYSALVSNPYGEVFSSNAFLSVVVAKPVLAITHPTQNEHLSNAVLVATGKTKSTVPLAAVFYQLNGAGWNPAQPAGGWTNWTVSLALKPGTNLFQAYAVDVSGDASLTNTVKFQYILSAPVTVLTNGFGSVTPQFNGKLLAIGEAYSMTAKPGRGFGFTEWTGSMVTNTPKLTFVMASNLSFTANFVDITRPVIAITAPKVNQRWSNALFTATGKASDNVAVASVFYQLNGAGWNLAQTSNGWTNWSANLVLSPGTNLVQAYAVDTSGNHSLTNSVKITYILSAPVAVFTNGLGTVTPQYNGALLAIGQAYSMTAMPGRGFAFTNWTGSIVANTPRLTFVMASNLTFTANFVATMP